MTWRHFFPAMLVVLMLAASCRTTREGGNGSRYRGMSQEKVMEKYQNSLPDFKTVTFKGKADFENKTENSSIGFSYKINVAKDSLIWASVSKLGIPAANILIDRDSVRMRIMLSREAVLCDFSVISQMTGFDVNFDMLQAFLLGNAYFTKDALLVSRTEPPVEFKGRMSPYQVSWFLNDQHFRLEKMVVKDITLGAESVLSYSDFGRVGSTQMANLMELTTTQPQAARITMKHSSIEFDDDKASFDFRIPSSYEVKPCGKSNR